MPDKQQLMTAGMQRSSFWFTARVGDVGEVTAVNSLRFSPAYQITICNQQLTAC